MTRSSKKAAERRYVEAFLAGLVDHEGVEDSECPDFWVRRPSEGPLALEVTEYHPAAESDPRVRRRAVEGRWRNELLPALDRARRSDSALMHVELDLHFKSPRLPPRADHAALASEIVRLARWLAQTFAADGCHLEISFVPHSLAARISGVKDGHFFAAQEHWPVAARHVNWLRFADSRPLKWPPWHCPAVDTAWLAVCPSELRSLLNTKAARAARFLLGGAPLWLLIVSDLPTDLQSEIFPTQPHDIAELRAAVRESAFDFSGGPFSEVWLMSAASGNRWCLHPLPLHP